jgi:hypothetical protein
MARWAVGEGPVPLPPRRRSTWRTLLTFGLPVVMVAGGLLGLLNLFRSDGSRPSGVPRVASLPTSALTPPAGAGPGTAGGTGLTGFAATTTSSQATASSVPRVTATTARQQALAINKLLDEADRTPSATTVDAAVASLARCNATPLEASTAATTLRTAATNRNDLLHRLQDVPVEALPDGPALRDALKETWSSGEEADRQYLAWAQTIASGYPCNPQSPSRIAGNVAAGNARRAGEEFVAIWNDKVAGPQRLAKRRVSDL